MIPRSQGKIPVSDEITALAKTEEPTPEVLADEMAGKDAAEKIAKQGKSAIRKVLLTGDDELLQWAVRFGVKLTAGNLRALAENCDLSVEAGELAGCQLAFVVSARAADANTMLLAVRTAAMIKRDAYHRSMALDSGKGQDRISIMDKDTAETLAKRAKEIEETVGMEAPAARVQEAEFEVRGETESPEEPAHADAGRT